jgi:hypothetical protein
MVYRTITPLPDHAGAEVVGLGFTLPIDAERRANFSRTAPNVWRQLCAASWPSGCLLPNYKDHPTKNGGRKGRTSWQTAPGGRLVRLR